MATVYLAPAPTGDDSRTYAAAQNSATPWATIGKCNTSATDGDTIVLLAGTHTWASVTFTKSFTIQGNTSDRTLYILDGAAAAVRWSDIRSMSVSNVTFQNATGAATDVYAIFSKLANNSAAMSFTDCTFKTLSLTNSSADGGLFSTSSSHSAQAFVLNLTRCSISATKSTTNSTAESALIMSRNAANNIYTIVGCTIVLPGTTAAGTQLNNLHYTAFANTNHTITYRSTIVYCPTTAVTWLSGIAATTTTATYNDFYQVTSSPSGTGTITSDPLLVDYANLNFNLRPTSPCIGTGSV